MARLVVVGFGLIGGSFALAQRRSEPSLEITAIDRPAALESEAVQTSTQRQVDVADARAVEASLRGADLVFVATPVRQAVADIARIVELAPLVTDGASTKRAIVAAAAQATRRSSFVPGHPMAGAARGTAARARADLFEGRRWIVCPEGADAAALATVETWLARTGAELCAMSVDEHDLAVAITSHLPQLMATALLEVATSRGAEKAAGPTFAEMTRTAGGPLAIWRDIFASNADNVAQALRALQTQLTTIAESLEASPADLTPVVELLEKHADRKF